MINEVLYLNQFRDNENYYRKFNDSLNINPFINCYYQGQTSYYLDNITNIFFSSNFIPIYKNWKIINLNFINAANFIIISSFFLKICTFFLCKSNMSFFVFNLEFHPRTKGASFSFQIIFTNFYIFRLF